jgi:hypothetical protein
MATLDELLKDQLKDTSKQDDDDDAGIIRSTLSGIVSGVIKIPEGAFSLGASIIDLGLGTNTAATVEKVFDKINIFEEAAEDTAAGKIAELIVNIGVPGGIAFKAGKNLAKTALSAKKAGTYFSLTGKGLADDVISKGVPKATKFNIAPINKEVQEFALNKKGKVLEYAGGAGLGGIAEGVFVGDVEDAGTLGDFIGGPTKMNREEGGTNRQRAKRELGNRLKFGTEGGVFTAALGLGGVGFNRLRKGPSDSGRAINDPMEKFWRYWSAKLSKKGQKTQNVFEATEAIRTSTMADERLSILGSETMESELYKLGPKMEKYWTTKEGAKDLTKKKELLNNALVDNLDNPDYYTKQLTKEGQDSGFTIKEILDDTKILRNTTGDLVEKAPLIEDGFTVKFKPLLKQGEEPTGSLKKFYDELGSNDAYGRGAPVDEVKDSIRLQMEAVRNRWGDMFSVYGNTLTKTDLASFKNVLKTKVSDFLDSGAEVFKNKTLGNLLINPITRTVVNEVADEIETVTKALNLKLPRNEIDQMVETIYNSATLERGFDFQKYDKSGIYFGSLPQLFTATQKSLGDAMKSGLRSSNLTKYGEGNLANIRNVELPNSVSLPDGSIFNRRELLEKLVGKSKDGLNTVITGTTRLSNLARRAEVNNEVIKNAGRQKIAVDNWLTSVDNIGEEATIKKLGQRPNAPMAVDTAEEATKYFGGVGGRMGSNGGKSTGDWVEMRFDSDIAPVHGLEKLSVGAIKVSEESARLTNNLAGKFSLVGNADALVRGDILNRNPGTLYNLYKNAFLYPKAGVQLAKTVLGPVTHARNFLSAAAFAGANGVLLNNDLKSLRTAWDTTLGPLIPFSGKKMSPEGALFYDKLLKLGVVNSNVSQGDIVRLLKDVGFGDTLGNLKNRSLNNIMGNFSKLKRYAQDAYTAEDDFWKIFTWLGEKTRLEKSLREIPNHKGLAIGEDIIQVLDDGTTRNLGKFNEDWLEKRAADLVKNNVPNYAYVSDFVKGLRKAPVGNFVSFPAEMMRTSTNIVETALKEINFQIKLPSGEIVKPLASVGKQRLRGMALTSVVVPTSLVMGAQVLYEVTEDEINALRRYVPKWSKNSTLIPIRNEDDSLAYVDFSNMNAYDLLSRPFQTVINAVDEGRTDGDGIMDDFIRGLATATQEIVSPFVTASIWTEAVQDIAPGRLGGRGGIDVDGRRLWNPNDTTGNKLWSQTKHILEAVAPLNWQQLRRLGLAASKKDSEDRFDQYGREYTLGKELAGMVGMRPVDVNPAQGIKYKITDYQRNVRNSRSLFTGRTLRGGPETPEDVIDAYINANRALYLSNRELYKDIMAARELGLSEDSVESSMKERGAGSTYRYLSQGIFKPYTISRAVKDLFRKNAEKIGVSNPLDAAEDIMNAIADRLSNTSILEGGFPIIENPFKDMPAATLGEVANVAPLPANVTSATPSLTGVNVNGSPFESLNLSQKITKDNTLDTFIP